MQQIVIFIAPPGAGKDTQAQMFADSFGFERFEVSKILEANFAKADLNDPAVAAQKKIWSEGGLMDSKFVMNWILGHLKQLHSEGKNLVAAGLMRKFEEAEVEAELFDQLYGKKNVWIFHIHIGMDESVKRNVHRRICEKERHPIPDLPEYKDITICPWDGSPLVHRQLDTPEIARERYENYMKETEPVLEFLRHKGYKVIVINGEQTIEKVAGDINRAYPGNTFHAENE